MVALTNDGLTGFRRVGRQRRHPSRARSRRLASRADRRRPLVHLPAAPGHPLLDRRARAAAGLPPRDRALARLAARPAAPTTPASSARAVPGRPEEAVRPLEGDRDRRGLEHRHLPPHRARPRLPATSSRSPRRTRCPPGRRSIRRGSLPATGPYEIASFDPKRGDPARPQPEVPRVVAGGPAERLPGRDRRALRRLAGRARRGGPARLGRSAPPDCGAGRRRPCSRPCGRSMPSQLELNPWDVTWLPRPQHPSCALRRRAGAPGVELRRRPGAAARPHRRARASAR